MLVKMLQCLHLSSPVEIKARAKTSLIHILISTRGTFFQEVNSILQQVVERNRVRRSLSAKRHALHTWRGLVETLLTACPADLIPADDRQLIIRDLLLDLHDKVSQNISHLKLLQHNILQGYWIWSF